MISAIYIRATDISCLIKHLLHSWPTSALISLFDVFSFLIVFLRQKIKEDTKINFLWDLESSFIDYVGGYLPLCLGIFNNCYCPTSIPIPTCSDKIVFYAFLIDLNPLQPTFLTFRFLFRFMTSGHNTPNIPIATGYNGITLLHGSLPVMAETCAHCISPFKGCYDRFTKRT